MDHGHPSPCFGARLLLCVQAGISDSNNVHDSHMASGVHGCVRGNIVRVHGVTCRLVSITSKQACISQLLAESGAEGRGNLVAGQV